MKKNLQIPVVVILIILLFSYPFILHGKLPIPSDTIIGLYHPFRDLYAKNYPNGIPYKNFLITDPVRQQYPWRHLATESEKHLQLPLWNPYSFAGTPLLANFQTAAFYPLNMLLFIFPFRIGWSFLILLQPLLSALFLYYYLQNLGLKKSASLLGGVVFAFCGYATAWMEWNTMVQVALWLPLSLLAIDKITARHTVSFRWSAIFILSLVFSFFAGHIQPFFYLALTVFFYFIARWLQSGRSGKIFGHFSLLFFIFIVLTAIQWLPTLQFINLSARNIDQIWQKDGWFIPYQHLIQFIAPDFFGNPATLNYWGTWNYGEMVGYVGIGPLIVALYAMFFRKDKKTLFFGTIFFLSLIFALPTFFAKLPFIWHIPFISTSQPTRLLFLTDFSLAVLAAFGIDYYIRQKKRITILYPIFFVGFILALLWIYILRMYAYTIPISPEQVAVAKHNLLLPTALYAAVSVLLIIPVFFSNISKKILILFLILTLFDLLRFTWKFDPFTLQQYLFPNTSAISYLQKQQKQGQFRIMTTDSAILPPNFSIMYHVQSLDGYDPLYLKRYGELQAAISRGKPDISAPFGFDRIITPTRINSPLIDLFGVKYILSLSRIKEPKLIKVFTEGHTRIYKNKNAFPRAFFVQRIQPAVSKKEAIDFLFAKNIDLHTTAIVEGWGVLKKRFVSGTVHIMRYQANAVSLLTKSNGESFLVLTDTFYPTWHVTIDGKKGKIYRTDYNFRGVLIPKGIHRVIFSDSLL